ncbi:DUF664 domain-containing protein [Nocardioides zhouii]|uniref:mycothiol transferase n=1 Tax=Nocardioides zhouii TaxID=1168729 RepID=UPI0013EAF261|nr:DUF664 domain-containing protein [Nocardioides zhouii]
MTTSDDLVRDELLGWLDSKRRHVIAQVEAMPAEARRRTHVPSGWTPLGLVRHLTLDVERVWLRGAMAGEPVEIPQGYDGWVAPDGLSDEQVLQDYRDECREASAAVASMPLGQGLAWWFDGERPYSSLREVLLHVLVETTTPRRPPRHLP